MVVMTIKIHFFPVAFLLSDGESKVDIARFIFF